MEVGAYSDLFKYLLLATVLIFTPVQCLTWYVLFFGDPSSYEYPIVGMFGGNFQAAFYIIFLSMGMLNTKVSHRSFKTNSSVDIHLSIWLIDRLIACLPSNNKQGRKLYHKLQAGAVKLRVLKLRDELRRSLVCVEECGDLPVGFWCAEIFQIDSDFCLTVRKRYLYNLNARPNGGINLKSYVAFFYFDSTPYNLPHGS